VNGGGYFTGIIEDDIFNFLSIVKELDISKKSIPLKKNLQNENE
jgi:hypothetical protein